MAGNRQTNNAARIIEGLADELVFCPEDIHRESKSAFWAVAADSPLVDPSNITLATALQITNDTRLATWWHMPGFPEWFANQHEFRQRIEYLLNTGLDAIEDILSDSDQSGMARIRAFEILARLANKEPAKVKEVKFADREIEGLTNPAQIESWLARQGYGRLLEEATDGATEDQTGRDTTDSGDSVDDQVPEEDNEPG